jgi:glycosyltransferase involved in cell wall biosynthesis
MSDLDVDKTLSIVIPARNEMFLARTIEDILEKKRGNTNIIIGLDGQWAEPVIKDHPDITIIHTSVSIGQRAMTNQCVRLSDAKYIMKVDAHCAFDEGFDVKLMADMQDDWTVVPTMRNLHAFDWKCYDCGRRTYQGPTPEKCDNCGSKNIKRKILWIGKENPQSNSYCFDREPHFQYFKEFSKRPEGQGDLTETMSLQGSCFMLTREKYWELNICDESFGSWGSQGIEVACKTWLSGGKCIVNHKTWYAHMFRTQGGDFGFPYENPGKKVEAAKSYARDLFFNNKWPKQVHRLSWLVEKFWPIPGWTDEDLKRIQ